MRSKRQITSRITFSIIVFSLAAAAFEAVAGGDVEQGDRKEKGDGDECDEISHRNLRGEGLGSTTSVLPF